MNSTETALASSVEPRFITGDWGHLFLGDKSERMTRILFDATADKLLRLDVQDNRALQNSYRPASREELAEVEDSLINGNIEVFDSPEDFGLLAVDTLPYWVTGGLQAGQVVFFKKDPAKYGPIKIEFVDGQIVGLAKVPGEKLPFYHFELFTAAALVQELEELIFGSGKIEYRRKQIGTVLSVLQAAAELAAA